MPPSRRAFDAMRGPDGAFFVGDPRTVAEKVLRVSEQLGGVERINLQMTNPRLRHADLLHSIELLGTEVEKSKGYIARAEGQAQAARQALGFLREGRFPR